MRSWSTGFSAQVTVENTGDNPVENWAVNWTMGGETVVDGWRGVWSQKDGLVTVKAGKPDTPLEAGKTLTLRFSGWHPAGKAPRPSGFALNGVGCHVTDHEDGQDGASPRPSSVALPPGASASPVPAGKPSAGKSAPAPSGPLGSLYVDTAGQVIDWLAANGGDTRAAVIRARIATKSQARWFGGADGVTSDVRAYTSRAASAGKVPVLVAYNMTNRDCGGASAGGASSADDYRAWIRNFAAGLGTRTSIVVLEPDALPHLAECLSAGQQAERLALMSYAGQVIKAASPKAHLYYDIGHSNWLSVSDAVERLRQAGAGKYGDGIALNTSNYYTNGAEVAYGKQILSALGVGRLQMVVDTSRNGAGPAGDGAWCDPAGRKLGINPTTATGDSKVAAFLWVKRPGESDGCSGPPGQFIPATAYAMSG
jgi:endoglucanase